jgi:hypothetical protein
MEKKKFIQDKNGLVLNTERQKIASNIYKKWTKETGNNLDFDAFVSKHYPLEEEPKKVVTKIKSERKKIPEGIPSHPPVNSESDTFIEPIITQSKRIEKKKIGHCTKDVVIVETSFQTLMQNMINSIFGLIRILSEDETNTEEIIANEYDTAQNLDQWKIYTRSIMSGKSYDIDSLKRKLKAFIDSIKGMNQLLKASESAITSQNEEITTSINEIVDTLKDALPWITEEGSRRIKSLWTDIADSMIDYEYYLSAPESTTFDLARITYAGQMGKEIADILEYRSGYSESENPQERRKEGEEEEEPEGEEGYTQGHIVDTKTIDIKFFWEKNSIAAVIPSDGYSIFRDMVNSIEPETVFIKEKYDVFVPNDEMMMELFFRYGFGNKRSNIRLTRRDKSLIIKSLIVEYHDYKSLRKLSFVKNELQRDMKLTTSTTDYGIVVDDSFTINFNEKGTKDGKKLSNANVFLVYTGFIPNIKELEQIYPKMDALEWIRKNNKTFFDLIKATNSAPLYKEDPNGHGETIRKTFFVPKEKDLKDFLVNRKLNLKKLDPIRMDKWARKYLEDLVKVHISFQYLPTFYMRENEPISTLFQVEEDWMNVIVNKKDRDYIINGNSEITEPNIRVTNGVVNVVSRVFKILEIEEEVPEVVPEAVEEPEMIQIKSVDQAFTGESFMDQLSKKSQKNHFVHSADGISYDSMSIGHRASITVALKQISKYLKEDSSIQDYLSDPKNLRNLITQNEDILHQLEEKRDSKMITIPEGSIFDNKKINFMNKKSCLKFSAASSGLFSIVNEFNFGDGISSVIREKSTNMYRQLAKRGKKLSPLKHFESMVKLIEKECIQIADRSTLENVLDQTESFLDLPILNVVRNIGGLDNHAEIATALLTASVYQILLTGDVLKKKSPNNILVRYFKEAIEFLMSNIENRVDEFFLLKKAKSNTDLSHHLFLLAKDLEFLSRDTEYKMAAIQEAVKKGTEMILRSFDVESLESKQTDEGAMKRTLVFIEMNCMIIRNLHFFYSSPQQTKRNPDSIIPISHLFVELYEEQLIRKPNLYRIVTI